ncbi:8-oxoguanine DNA glycosylase [Fusibacter paucivorans]|uniref:DNA-(apurinic or apyrimidinic site) lyase n=1 Tax=Fusibacter paucivorans TaxID=76009 RepID=A0ABS5PKQ5_9FIRM|nr:DNA glycosylase [Fusibacter paucivorans]MBS7525750.1 8-oxoguanine DNA glycosylase [Fusibacter paucivorans]
MSKLWLSAATFHPVHTFENGQCFRWRAEGDAYVGVIDAAVVCVTQADDGKGYWADVVLGTLSEARLKDYFDEATDYETIMSSLREQDEWLQKAVDYGCGLRLLRQNSFEMLLSFIISSNNNIPKIRMSIEDLCQKYGLLLGSFHDKDYYAFPTLEVLANLEEEAFSVKAVGYRSKALFQTVRKLSDEALDLDVPSHMTLEEATAWLRQFYGVGEKVAHCILLFGYYQTDAYPIDTWVKQLLTTLYGVEANANAYKAFIENYFVMYRGYAQQMLFYYMRSCYSKSKS